MKVLAVIPARYASTRLPGKMLLAETGRPLVQYVHDAAVACPLVDRVVVATDDRRIAEAVRTFEGEAVLTPACETGTDRVSYAAAGYLDYDLVLNVQGDQPELLPEALTTLIQDFDTDDDGAAATLVTAFEPGEAARAGVVRALVGNGEVIYFTRNKFEYARIGRASDAAERGELARHVGVYAFRPAVLQEFRRMPQTALEKLEDLEQLRLYALPYVWQAIPVDRTAVGNEVNTREDYDRFVVRGRGVLLNL